MSCYKVNLYINVTWTQLFSCSTDPILKLLYPVETQPFSSFKLEIYNTFLRKIIFLILCRYQINFRLKNCSPSTQAPTLFFFSLSLSLSLSLSPPPPPPHHHPRLEYPAVFQTLGQRLRFSWPVEINKYRQINYNSIKILLILL